MRSLLTSSLGILLALTFQIACVKGDGQTHVAIARQADHAWTLVTEHASFPEGYNFPVFVAKGRMWAFHAEGVWESRDAKIWTKAELPSIRQSVYNTQYIQFKDAVYAIGDHTGNYESISFSPRVRRTTDFRKWEDVAGRSNLPGRIFAGIAVFQNKIWLLGGYDGRNYHNDVWNSADGVTWTRVTNNAAWTPRSGSTVTIFRDKIFLIGGSVIDGTPNSNPGSDREIWSSADGSAWTQVRTNLQNRSGGTPVVFDEKLWLVGANRDGTFARSSLVSDDAATWNEAPAPWSPRGGVAAWIFDGKLYITGGKYSVTENGQIRFIYSNDVWAMERPGKS